jgi:hypothetical protein
MASVDALTNWADDRVRWVRETRRPMRIAGNLDPTAPVQRTKAVRASKFSLLYSNSTGHEAQSAASKTSEAACDPHVDYVIVAERRLRSDAVCRQLCS